MTPVTHLRKYTYIVETHGFCGQEERGADKALKIWMEVKFLLLVQRDTGKKYCSFYSIKHN